jgi:glycosyltransferase involved in cell wall biosynthesis
MQAITPYGRAGPSSRVRVHEWVDRVDVPIDVACYLGYRNSSPRHLAAHPAAVIAAERRLRAIAAGPLGHLLLHREASPLSRGTIERRLLERATFAVYDFDDALQWDYGVGGLARRIAPKAPKALLAARTADRVIAGNAVLADWASQHNRDVVIVPSCVDTSAYDVKTRYEAQDPPRLGWIGSSGNESYLLLIEEALREVHRRTGARLTLVGTPEPRLGELESMIDRIAWTETVQHEVLASIDIGLAPIPDRPYERGKSGYKLLQYAAAGTPVVASPVGVNADLLSQFGVPAPVEPAAWVDVLLDLLDMSADERRRLGTRARDVVERGYSYQAWHDRWIEAVGLSG